jgi:hypothetical protein
MSQTALISSDDSVRFFTSKPPGGIVAYMTVFWTALGADGSQVGTAASLSSMGCSRSLKMFQQLWPRPRTWPNSCVTAFCRS